MPIVNGTYVPTTLSPGSAGNQSGWINQAFGPGKFSSHDWSDVKTAAYNYLLNQQDKAYQLELWNLQNEYNLPANQMARYLDAGLNPNLIYSQQNTAAAPGAPSYSPFKSQGTQAKRVQNQLAMISEAQAIVRSAAETFDYLTFGRSAAKTQASFRTSLLGHQVQAQQISNDWNAYLTYLDQSKGQSPDNVAGSPRATTYQYQQDLTYQNWERAKFIVSNLLPAQEERQRALKALDDKQYEIMSGKTSAILDIDLGLGEKVNQWARLVLFMSMAKMF